MKFCCTPLHFQGQCAADVLQYTVPIQGFLAMGHCASNVSLLGAMG